MRITDKFAKERKTEIKNYKPKYFIASEGSNSEPLYFEGLSNSILFENISIINILRDYAYTRSSHPSFIINMLKEFILNVTNDKITVLELKNKIANCIYENSYKIKIDDIYEKLINIKT